MALLAPLVAMISFIAKRKPFSRSSLATIAWRSSTVPAISV